MPITRIIYKGKVDNENILDALENGLQKIIASELSTSDFLLSNESIILVFEKGHPRNKGKDLIILVDGNDFPERTENVQERSDKIAEKVRELLSPLNKFGEPGFVYVTLQAGGLGTFKF
jgi:hypothetical protein